MAAYYKTGLLGLMLVLAIRLMATVRSATNMVRMRTLAHSQAATMLFFMNISLLLFGITADITLGPKLGNIIALSTGLIFTLGISARQSIEDVEIQGVLSEMDYASV